MNNSAAMPQFTYQRAWFWPQSKHPCIPASGTVRSLLYLFATLGFVTFTAADMEFQWHSDEYVTNDWNNVNCFDHEVYCSGGRVYALVFRSDGLSGPLPTEFGELDALRNL